MRRGPGLIALLLLIAPLTTRAQAENANAHGAAVKRSLDRSRALFPDAAKPNSPLSQAILNRIEFLNRTDRAFFSDDDWPLRLTSEEAFALGIRPVAATPRATIRPRASDRHLGVVTQNFSVTGASFRKGQQIILESLEYYRKRGTTLVDGRPVLIWLDHVKILKTLRAGDAVPVVVKVESARYGFPGETGHSISGMVQSLISPNASGRYEILVSDALLSPSTAQRMNRSAAVRPPFDPYTGRPNPRSHKVLTVTYTINGVTKTKQGIEGEKLVLD